MIKKHVITKIKNGELVDMFGNIVPAQLHMAKDKIFIMALDQQLITDFTLVHGWDKYVITTLRNKNGSEQNADDTLAKTYEKKLAE